MKIALVWPGSSGKTTLAKWLYKYLREYWYKLDINAERELAKKIWFNFKFNTKEEVNKYQEMLFEKQL